MYQPVNIKKELLFFIGLFVALSLVVFWVLNGGAYFNRLTYAIFGPDVPADPIPTEGSIVELTTTKHPATSTADRTDPAIPILNAGERMLVIPKIHVTAPIIAPLKDTMPEILATMEKGVGLYPGSNLPGQGGRGVILGHSSRASWYRGNYAYIFSLLSKLEVGDEFYIMEGRTRYTYRVFEKKFLTPSDTNALLAGQSRGSEIDLITCYPVGSASKRTLIRGEVIRTEPI